MIRLVVVVVALLAARADAKMMVHYDLAGLILNSDAVVVAQKVGPGPNNTTSYRVVRVLRGNPKIGEIVDAYDKLYVPPNGAVDPQVVMFLNTFDGKRQVVASGLRVFVKGKAYRFEQRNNPGPFDAVAQGQDPSDMWGNGGAQLDLAGLEKAIAAAAKRVDALAAARQETDPAKRRAAVLALFPPPRGARSTGFYVDRLADDARLLLGKSGDLEGALMVELRDRSGSSRRSDYASVAQLLQLAGDSARPSGVRAQAIEVVGRGLEFLGDEAAMRAVIKLFDDPEPLVRAAAVATAARPANATMSDPTAQRIIARIVADAHTAMVKRFAIEQDPRVLVAILDAFEYAFRKPPPTRTTGPFAVARVTIESGYLNVDVYCVRPTTITAGKLSTPMPEYQIRNHCGPEPRMSFASAAPKPLAAGRYPITVDLATKTSPSTVISLGTLVVDAAGELLVTP